MHGKFGDLQRGIEQKDHFHETAELAHGEASPDFQILQRDRAHDILGEERQLAAKSAKHGRQDLRVCSAGQDRHAGSQQFQVFGSHAGPDIGKQAGQFGGIRGIDGKFFSRNIFHQELKFEHAAGIPQGTLLRSG